MVRFAIGQYNGSSPRSWGTPSVSKERLAAQRFIPTLVGNTTLSEGTKADFPVHPHARGEHSHPFWYELCYFGSSPRSWGTLLENMMEHTWVRFIPTLVGNTRSSMPSRRHRPVHPHARGEHPLPPIVREVVRGSSPRSWGTLQGAFFVTRIYGSSPRSWGTRRISCMNFCIPRFIPTLVGNTLNEHDEHHAYPVHPHARGEHH